jgi:hypothetical protein
MFSLISAIVVHAHIETHAACGMLAKTLDKAGEFFAALPSHDRSRKCFVMIEHAVLLWVCCLIFATILKRPFVLHRMWCMFRGQRSRIPRPAHVDLSANYAHETNF